MSVSKKEMIIQIRNLTAFLVVKANGLNIKGKWRVQHYLTCLKVEFFEKYVL